MQCKTLTEAVKVTEQFQVSPMRLFYESIRLALSSIRANKLRSFLTLIGVIFGVVAVVGVASVIEGFFKYVNTAITNDLGANTVVLDKFGMITSYEEFIEAARRNKDITLDDYQYLRERATLARFVAAQGQARAEAKVGSKQMPSVTVRGVTASMAEIDTTQAASGRYLNEADEEHSRYVALIGYAVADELFGSNQAIGREIKIDGLPFEIIGVAEEAGTVFGQSQDEFAIIPLSTFQKIWGARSSLSVSLRGQDQARLQDLQDQVRMLMRSRHHLGYQDKDTFGLTTADAVNSFLQSLLATIVAVALGVTSISLVVGGIVVMNIMLVAVTERTQEIGLRKSVGARRQDILMQFLVESTVLAGCGGAIGLGLAYLVKWILINYTAVPAAVPAWAVAAALLVSSGVGIIFGIYPAWKAARLNPVDAMRAE
jgi:putative ABC transport system permease protein